MHPPFDSRGSQTQGAQCAQHALAPATTICSRCGSYACRLCARVGEDGLDYCASCVSRVEVLAERSDRFWANLVDQFLLVLPWIGSMVLSAILAASGGEESAAVAGVVALLGFLGMLAVGAYQLHLVVQTGQTIGKRMLGIRVIRSDGSPVTFGRIFLLRNLLPGFINAACGLFSIVDALFIFNDDRRCIHDMIADTKVVKVPASERRS